MKKELLINIILVGTLAFLSIFVSVFAFRTNSARAQSSGDCVELYINSLLVFSSDSCGVAQPTPTELPTETPTEQPPLPTPPQSVEPYPDAPLCLTHSDRTYHSLWNSDLGCHYDHTHGDNPHLVDDVFGTEVYRLMEGEISYPWHTAGENEEIKHKSYQWLVEKDLPCFSQFSDGCVIHYRAFVHNDLHNVFSTHHSALVEAYICDENNPSNCGRMLVSGHQATGDLLIDNQIVLDRDEPAGAPRPVMLHYDQLGNRDFATWYPVFSAWMRVSTEIGDMFGYYPIPNVPLPATNEQLEFVRLNGDASRVQPHVISVGFSRRNLLSIGVDPDSPVINYRGFLDVRSGEPADCVEINAHCAPLIIENVPNIGQFQHRGNYKEFDIFFNGASSGWIVFPGFAP